MAIPITQLKGIDDDLATQLKAQGIADSDQLLTASAAPADRKALANKTGAKERDILELANRADLSRVKGVAGVF
jgi:hypothetical protein